VRSEVLQRGKHERNILDRLERRRADWIGYILRGNCLLKHVIEEKIEQTRRQGRRLQQLLDERKERRRYRKLTDEAPVAHFGAFALAEVMDM